MFGVDEYRDTFLLFTGSTDITENKKMNNISLLVQVKSLKVEKITGKEDFNSAESTNEY